jgi:uncharacterized membrane protein YkvA (DUF1232 family)
MTERYQKHYTENAFRNKLKSVAGSLGRKAVENALVLYYVGTDANTPAAAKLTIFGCLGYLIFPFDMIPDFIPLLGMTDDALALYKAVRTISDHISDSHRQRAQAKVLQWFGPKGDTPQPAFNEGEVIDI